ncbi:lipoprotein 17-related variable surface protein, partial [Mycoplasmopsis pulmonis]|uniref:lipoprotein 17-related variable surface protein n=1 Tax=Mycoplasmopsis pulmonis TaxID=2107 RepID=UPI002ACEF7C2
MKNSNMKKKFLFFLGSTSFLSIAGATLIACQKQDDGAIKKDLESKIDVLTFFPKSVDETAQWTVSRLLSEYRTAKSSDSNLTFDAFVKSKLGSKLGSDYELTFKEKGADKIEYTIYKKSNKAVSSTKVLEDTKIGQSDAQKVNAWLDRVKSLVANSSDLKGKKPSEVIEIETSDVKFKETRDGQDVEFDVPTNWGTVITKSSANDAANDAEGTLKVSVQFSSGNFRKSKDLNLTGLKTSNNEQSGNNSGSKDENSTPPKTDQGSGSSQTKPQKPMTEKPMTDQGSNGSRGNEMKNPPAGGTMKEENPPAG